MLRYWSSIGAYVRDGTDFALGTHYIEDGTQATEPSGNDDELTEEELRSDSFQVLIAR